MFAHISFQFFSLSMRQLIISGIEGQSGKDMCVREISLTLVSYIHSSYIGMNVCYSDYENGCMVDGVCVCVCVCVCAMYGSRMS